MYPQRFTNVIDKLVKAFFEGNLEAGNCKKCAVGNVIEAENSEWYFGAVKSLRKDEARIAKMHAESIQLEERFGYPLSVIDKVEETFEQASTVILFMEQLKTDGTLENLYSVREKHTDKPLRYFNGAVHESQITEEMHIQSQFAGLMAVVDLLCEIEGIENPIPVKEKFTHHPLMELSV